MFEIYLHYLLLISESAIEQKLMVLLDESIPRNRSEFLCNIEHLTIVWAI